jgi:hypothetical protein
VSSSRPRHPITPFIGRADLVAHRGEELLLRAGGRDRLPLADREQLSLQLQRLRLAHQQPERDEGDDRRRRDPGREQRAEAVGGVERVTAHPRRLDREGALAGDGEGGHHLPPFLVEAGPGPLSRRGRKSRNSQAEELSSPTPSTRPSDRASSRPLKEWMRMVAPKASAWRRAMRSGSPG